MLPTIILGVLVAVAAAADLPLDGTWVGERPALPPGTTVVVAVYDRTGTCCGGPAVALAALANLRDSLKARAATVVIAIDSTPGVTPETARAAAGEHLLTGLPLLADASRSSGGALGAASGRTMSYVVVKPDGTRTVCATPAEVRRLLDG